MSSQSSSVPTSSASAPKAKSSLPSSDVPSSALAPKAQSSTAAPDAPLPPSSSSSSPAPDESICAHCNHPLSAHEEAPVTNEDRIRKTCLNCKKCPKGKKTKTTCGPPPKTKGPPPPRGPIERRPKPNTPFVYDRQSMTVNGSKGKGGTTRVDGYEHLYTRMVYFVHIPLLDRIKALLDELERWVVLVMGSESQSGYAKGVCDSGYLGSVMVVY